MSLWTSFRDTAVRAGAAYVTGGASEVYYQARDQQIKNRPAPQQTYSRAIVPFDDNSQGGAEMIPGGGPKAGVVINMARGVATAARYYCTKYPMWCASLPAGLGTVLQMVKEGKLPKPKRRRRRGISAGDLSKFRRVAGFLHKWGPMCGPGHARRPRSR
jgi:hypothetical protein